jgi:hypothetical protein
LGAQVGRAAFKRRATPFGRRPCLLAPLCIASFHLPSPRMGDTRRLFGRRPCLLVPLCIASFHLPSLLTDQRFEGWPPKGFNSRLRSRGPYTHYWSEVRRPAPRRVPRPPQATRAPRPLLIRGSKAGPRRVHSRLRRRARDDQGYVRYITKARAALPRYPRTFPRPTGAIL